MYQRILVGYDGTKGGRDALSLARALVAVEGASLILATALELDPLATPTTAYERATAEAEEKISAAAREQLAGSAGGEPPFKLRTAGGVSPPRALVEFAEDERADVIVLGSTHREGLGRVLPGSVGERILHDAPCAVMVAPSGFADQSGGEHPIRSIGVGYDGRTESTHARDVAASLANDLGAEVEEITVEEGQGDPAELLAARSKELDLLVVGSRGHGPVHQIVLGSVSSEVMRSSACPVLVVPRSASEQAS